MASLGRQLQRQLEFQPEAWAVNLGVLGFILTLTGAHMTLTWPFAKYFPFDNLVFGEPSLALGVLLLVVTLYLWRRAEPLRSSPDLLNEAAALVRPLTFFLVGLGLSLLAIACAGIVFQLFAAPPAEPISGAFAAYPWVAAIFIPGWFALVGLAVLLLPFALRQTAGVTSGLSVLVWWLLLSGLAFLLFGVLNYYTHIRSYL